MADRAWKGENTKDRLSGIPDRVPLRRGLGGGNYPNTWEAHANTGC